MAELSIGADLNKSVFFELQTYTILNNIAYSSGVGVISYRNITRITYKPSVQYQDGTIDLYLIYTYGGLLGTIDSTGYDSIVDSLSLTEVSGYNIQNNRAVPVGGDAGVDYINTSLVNKVVIIPNINLDGKPITLYGCFDVSNNLITYTDLVGYSTITGLGLYTYSVSIDSYQSSDEACANGRYATTSNVYSTGDTIDDSLILYTNTSLTTPFNSDGIVYITSTAKSLQLVSKGQYSISTNPDGSVLTVAECSVQPTPTPTPTPSATMPTPPTPTPSATMPPFPTPTPK